MASPEKPAQIVSVPLPGFSGLRPHNTQSLVDFFVSFSPVAGIQWVETLLVRLPGVVVDSFSPVAGIQWVETRLYQAETIKSRHRFQSRCRDSVG